MQTAAQFVEGMKTEAYAWFADTYAQARKTHLTRKTPCKDYWRSYCNWCVDKFGVIPSS